MDKEPVNKVAPQDIRERTFQFSLDVVRLYKDLDKQSNTGRILGKQLLRSGTSIGANVEEAQAGQSKADFISKNAIALKEARETVYWLKLLGASEVAMSAQLSGVLSEAEQLSRILGAIIVTAKNGKRKR
ncbi:MAG TPA: four helix bundle protein [Candidatus Manganitrophaceae bacterium]